MAAWMEAWSYGMWTAMSQRAGEAERSDRCALIKEEAREAAERG
jgi:hypothetical protein